MGRGGRGGGLAACRDPARTRPATRRPSSTTRRTRSTPPSGSTAERRPAGRLLRRARRVRGGRGPPLLRGPRAHRPVLVPCRVRGRPRRRGGRRRRARSRARCWAASARTSTCCGRSSCRSSARSPSRCGSPSWRCPARRWTAIERVYSIAAALAQADEFLRSRPWSIQTTYNTAGAAKQVADRGERGAAAVASARVADIYGLAVLADDIQGGDDNRTRFAVIARAGDEAAVTAAARPEATAGPPRTTLVFAVRNVPGSLHRSLGAFAGRGLNLSRLESRPWTARGARWEYLFWVDLDADPADPDVRGGPRRAGDRDRGRPDPGHVRPRRRGLTARAGVRSWADPA